MRRRAPARVRRGYALARPRYVGCPRPRAWRACSRLHCSLVQHRQARRDGASGEGSMSAEDRPQGGQLAAAISKTVVRALARTTGRGPTKAKTTLGDNGVFVVLQDSMARG